MGSAVIIRTLASSSFLLSRTRKSRGFSPCSGFISNHSCLRALSGSVVSRLFSKTSKNDPFFSKRGLKCTLSGAMRSALSYNSLVTEPLKYAACSSWSQVYSLDILNHNRYASKNSGHLEAYRLWFKISNLSTCDQDEPM